MCVRVFLIAKKGWLVQEIAGRDVRGLDWLTLWDRDMSGFRGTSEPGLLMVFGWVT